MNRKKLWFTLVELIIVITILSILATVSFISIWNYAAQSRDTARLSDLKILEKALNLSQIETGWYPLPLNATVLEEIDWIEWIKWKKWKFWEEQYLAVKRLDKLPLDPTSKETYDYYLSENGQYYRLESKKELSDEKIIITNFKNIINQDNNVNSSLNIPLTAMLYWNTEEIASCNRNAWDRFIIENWTIKDNLTWLYWEKEPSIKENWHWAKNRCSSLILWWYSDWRLPNMTELRSIVNYSCWNLSTYNWFKLSSDYYWSSTPVINDNFHIWGIHFYSGWDNWIYITDGNSVICVR